MVELMSYRVARFLDVPEVDHPVVRCDRGPGDSDLDRIGMTVDAVTAVVRRDCGQMMRRLETETAP
jgi:hypothetical protein